MAMTEPAMQARHANLRRLLHARHVAVVGGERIAVVLETLRRGAYAGHVWPVSRRARQIAGIEAFPDFDSLPSAPDATFIGVPAEQTVEVVRTLSACGAGGAVAYASGFAEAGGAALQRRLIDASGNLALIGPNCFGLINAVNGASLWPLDTITPKVARGAAILAQSGNFSINIATTQRDMPVAYNISIGNQAVLGLEDYIEVLAADPAVQALGICMEGIRDVPRFAAAAAAACANGIPIVALKIGTSALGAQLTVSHTGSLAGTDALYAALFERTGIVRVETVASFVDTLKALMVLHGRPCRRVAVFSCSGGDAGLAADWADRMGLVLPQPGPAESRRLAQALPAFACAGNPQDYSNALWGAEQPLREVFAAGLAATADVGMLIIDSPTEPVTAPIAATLRALGHASRGAGKPAAVVPMLPENLSPSTRALIAAEGLFSLHGIDDAFRALSHAADHAEAGMAPAVPMQLGPLPCGRETLVDESTAKRLLAGAGIQVPIGEEVALDGVAAAARRIGGPVAVKALSANLAHKSECGAVVLGCNGGESALRAARAIKEAVERVRPDLPVERFLVEAMVRAPVAELIAGVRRDPQFGYSLIVGAGGTAVELERDTALLLLPSSPAAIERSLRRCRVAARLDGHRGGPRADWAAAISAIQAIANFALQLGDRVLELEINPLMVLPEGCGVVAADALLRWMC
jgi:acyl-CoA synthetase (NDP forming)